MGKSAIIVAGIIIFIGVSGFIFLNNTNQLNPPSQTTSPESNQMMPSTSDPKMTDQIASDSAMMGKTIMVESNGLNFTPKEIRVKKGDTVTITYKNNMGQHDFTLDEFNVQTKMLKAGESETVSFVAAESGSFEFYCSVPGHRQAGMKGMLIVE